MLGRITIVKVNDVTVKRHRRCSPLKWHSFSRISIPSLVGLAVLLSALVSHPNIGYCFAFSSGFVLSPRHSLQKSRTEELTWYLRGRSIVTDSTTTLLLATSTNDDFQKNIARIFHLWPFGLSISPVDTQVSLGNSFDVSNVVDIMGPVKKYNNNYDGKIPFIIERLSTKPPPKIYNEIAQMCINAFFNTENSMKHGTTSTSIGIPVWKEWQLAYLRTLQAGDLERRRRREPLKNTMFIARRVIPVSSVSLGNDFIRRPILKQQPLVLDTNLIRNRPSNKSEDDYMYGDIVGFVEVTQRPYGLGEEGRMVERPVLTNLSVCRSARQSGVGSALVEACERVAYQEYCGQPNRLDGRDSASDDNRKTSVVPEIVLEVEEDNVNAIQFYRKRGYMDVFTDPTSRRYDTSGLWLQQVRCKRLVMKKDLRRPFMLTSIASSNNNVAVANMENTVNMGIQAFQRLRDNLLNVQ